MLFDAEESEKPNRYLRFKMSPLTDEGLRSIHIHIQVNGRKDEGEKKRKERSWPSLYTMEEL